MEDPDYPKIVHLKSIGSTMFSSTLTVVQDIEDIPMHFSRFFYTYGFADNEKRGGHAHKKITQAFIALNGSFTVKTENKSGNVTEFKLNKPHECLVVPPLNWTDIFNYKNNAICFVMTNGKFDQDEYIRNKNEFLFL